MSDVSDPSDVDAVSEPAWESGEAAAELSAFAARLVRVRSHEGLGRRCEQQRFAGEAIDRFAATRELSSTIAGRVGPRRECRERGGDDIPEAVTKGMRHNQKPFHLWNVERIEDDEEKKFDRVDGLIVGRAAALPEELRPPRTLKKATRVLREWLEEKAFQDVMLKMDKKRNAKLLRDKLPYGRADDDPGEVESIVIQPGESFDRFSSFIRLPDGLPARPTRDLDDDDDDGPRLGPPPSFDFSQPDDEEDGPRLGPPPSFDFSQPDDEDEPPGPSPAGFDFSQPDDD